MSKAGRPSSYSDEIAEEICARLADDESLLEICREERMPTTRSVYRWLLDEKNETFRRNYARARELQAEHLFDEMREIADDGRNDWMERNGFTCVNGEAIQRSRLRLEDRKWRAGKLKPKVYGDAPGTQVNVTNNTAIVCSEEQRARILAQRERLLGRSEPPPLEAGE